MPSLRMQSLNSLFQSRFYLNDKLLELLNFTSSVSNLCEKGSLNAPLRRAEGLTLAEFFITKLNIIQLSITVVVRLPLVKCTLKDGITIPGVNFLTTFMCNRRTYVITPYPFYSIQTLLWGYGSLNTVHISVLVGSCSHNELKKLQWKLVWQLVLNVKQSS